MISEEPHRPLINAGTFSRGTKTEKQATVVLPGQGSLVRCVKGQTFHSSLIPRGPLDPKFLVSYDL